jgi:type II secretory ATPase GspE/PulE/Tfp pilus assembly ATPase PilB-like protein
MFDFVKKITGTQKQIPLAYTSTIDKLPNGMCKLPSDLENRVLIADNKVYISAEVTSANASLLSFLSYARRQGFNDSERLPPDAFQRLLKKSHDQPRTESEIQALAAEIIGEAFGLGGSDIHIADYGPFASVELRVLGMIQKHRQLMGDTGRELITAIYQTLAESTDSTFSPSKRQDGRIVKNSVLPAAVHSIRLHTEPIECSMALGGKGTFLAMRLLYDQTEAIGGLQERLGLLGYSRKQIESFSYLTQRSGLTLISGPTGHGKSTALKHIMECMAADNPEKSYMSIEDPPEYPLENVKQVLVSNNYDSGPNERGEKYRDAIAGAMRSDPDTLMVGEIRFPDAAAAALDAAQTGHGVWTTIHSNSAWGIIQRMVAMLRAAQYPDPLEYLCDHTVLAGLVHQRLVPVLCEDCKIPLLKIVKDIPDNDAFRMRVLPKAVLNRIMQTVQPKLLENVHVRGHGCPKCRERGISGQTVAAEIVATDQVILNHLRSGSLERAHKHWRTEQGGQTFVAHAVELIEQGKIDPHLSEMRLGVPLNYAKAFEDSKLSSAEITAMSGLDKA